MLFPSELGLVVVLHTQGMQTEVWSRVLWWHPEPNSCSLYSLGDSCPCQLLAS